MESLTKNRQNEETLRRMVGRFFHPLELQSYKELTEGYFNVAYEVTLSSGEAVILKVAPAASLYFLYCLTAKWFGSFCSSSSNIRSTGFLKFSSSSLASDTLIISNRVLKFFSSSLPSYQI